MYLKQKFSESLGFSPFGTSVFFFLLFVFCQKHFVVGHKKTMFVALLSRTFIIACVCQSSTSHFNFGKKSCPTKNIMNSKFKGSEYFRSFVILSFQHEKVFSLFKLLILQLWGKTHWINIEKCEQVNLTSEHKLWFQFTFESKWIWSKGVAAT